MSLKFKTSARECVLIYQKKVTLLSLLDFNEYGKMHLALGLPEGL